MTSNRKCAKARYRDHDQAIGALHTLYAVSTRDHNVARAYQCPLCRGWHLTSRHDAVSSERRPSDGARRAVPAVAIRTFLRSGVTYPAPALITVARA